METQLRPLTLGEILDRTAALYRSNFLLFAGISTIPPALVLVWKLMEIAVVHEVVVHHGTRQANLVVAPLLGFGALIISFILSGLALAANARAVSSIQFGSSTGILQAYSGVKPHWFRYLSLMVAVAVYSWGPSILMLGTFFAGVIVQQSMHITARSPNFWIFSVVYVVAFLAMLVTVPFSIWMMLRFALAVPASIFEDLRIHASIKRSVSLTKNGRFRIFVMFLLVVVVVYVIAIGAQLPFIFLAMKAKGVMSVAQQIGSAVVNFIVSSLIGPIYGIAITLFYYDERIRKEGFDIEWMMKQANLDAAPPPPLAAPPPEPSLG